MQTLDTPMELNDPIDPNDPFAYGWRYVKEVLPDGSEKWQQVPLTLEDVLHPQEEDFRLHNDTHIEDCTYLRTVFQAQLAESPGAYVLNDCRVAWDAEGKYGHGPDSAVIFNVREQNGWGTFNVIEEGTRPALIVEVTSPSARSTDLYNKVREYAEVGVPHYVIANARERGSTRRLELIDYHLSGAAYVRRPCNAEGRVWLPEVKLWLGTEGGQLVCYDIDGDRKGTYAEVEAARAEAEQLAADQSLARARAEHRAKLEARSRADAENKALEETAARADAERKASDAERKMLEEAAARADAERLLASERAAREALEARLREMEARLPPTHPESKPGA